MLRDGLVLERLEAVVLSSVDPNRVVESDCGDEAVAREEHPEAEGISVVSDAFTEKLGRLIAH